MSEIVEPEEFFLERAGRQIPKRLKKLRGTATVTPALTKFSGKGNPYRLTRTGFRADIGINCRSGWEANVMRILKSYGTEFEFEPSVFYYPIKRGTKAYTPDILLTSTGEWIEVKGYFDDASRIKIKRFKKYYPEEFALLTMIIGKSSKRALQICEELEVPTILYYEDLSRIFKTKINNWEGR